MASYFIVHSFIVCLHVESVFQDQLGMHDHRCCSLHMAAHSWSEGMRNVSMCGTFRTYMGLVLCVLLIDRESN